MKSVYATSFYLQATTLTQPCLFPRLAPLAAPRSLQGELSMKTKMIDKAVKNKKIKGTSMVRVG